MRESPRPYTERFADGQNVPHGFEAVLCLCGNLYQRQIGSKVMRCSHICERRYEGARSPFERPKYVEVENS